MNSLRLQVQCWALKHLPLIPEIRRLHHARHLEKCLNLRHSFSRHSCE
ncbi:MAG TPA: hypothetical protein V6D10_00800 [Trichocoleus sp.]